MRITATITAKGQVTIPREIRNRIKGRIVEFVLENEKVELRSVQSAAGSLAEYSRGFIPLEEAREATWGSSGEK